MTTLFPSTYPSSSKPCRNASRRSEIAVGVLTMRYPIRGTFDVCCAPTGLPKATIDAANKETKHFIFTVLLVCISSHVSSDHLIRPRQHVGRNRQADLLCRFQIDDEFEFCRLFNREIGRLGAFQNLVHIRSGAPVQVEKVHAVIHKPPFFYKPALVIYDG